MFFGFLLQYLELREFEYDVRTFVDFYTVSAKPAEKLLQMFLGHGNWKCPILCLILLATLSEVLTLISGIIGLPT